MASWGDYITLQVGPDVKASAGEVKNYKITVQVLKHEPVNCKIYLMFANELAPDNSKIKLGQADPKLKDPWNSHAYKTLLALNYPMPSEVEGLFVEWELDQVKQDSLTWEVPYTVTLAAGNSAKITAWVIIKPSGLPLKSLAIERTVEVDASVLALAVAPQVKGAVQIDATSWIGPTEITYLDSSNHSKGQTVELTGIINESLNSIYGRWRLKAGNWSNEERIFVDNSTKTFTAWPLGRSSTSVAPDLSSLQGLLAKSGNQVALELQFSRDTSPPDWEISTSCEFSVDLDPPKLTDLAIRTTTSTKGHLALQGQVKDPDSGIKTVEASWDGGANWIPIEEPDWVSYNLTIDAMQDFPLDLSQGVYVRARDNVNNVSAKELVKIDVKPSSPNNAAPHVTWSRTDTVLKGQTFRYQLTIVPPVGAIFPPLKRIAFELPSGVTFIQGWIETSKGIVKEEPLTKESAFVFSISSPAFDFITLVIDAQVDTVTGEELAQASVTLESDYFNASFTSKQDEHIKPGDPGTLFVPLPYFILDALAPNPIEPDQVILKGKFNQPLLDAVHFQYSLDNGGAWVDLVGDVAQAHTTFQFSALDKTRFNFATAYRVTLRARYRNDPRADIIGTTWAEDDKSVKIISEQDHLFGLVYLANTTLDAHPISVPDDGSTKITLTATVRDHSRNGVSGLQVKWENNVGVFVLGSPGTVTDAHGRVTASLTSNAVGAGTVHLKTSGTTVIHDLKQAAVAFTKTHDQEQADLQALIDTSNSQLVADRNPVFVDESVTLTATFVDKNKAPIVGLDVSWGNNAGTFSTRGATTNAQGKVTAILTYDALSKVEGQVEAKVSAGTAITLAPVSVTFKPYLPEFDLDDLSKITCYQAVKVSGKFKQALREDVIISVGKDDTNWQNLSPLIDKSQSAFSMMAPEALFKDASGTPDLYVRARYSTYLDVAASWVKHQGKVTIDNTVPVLEGLRTYVEGVNVVLTGKVTAPTAPNNPVTVQVEWDNSKNLRDAIVTRNSDGTSQFTQMVALTDIKDLLVPAVVHAKTLAGMDIQQEQKISFSQLTPELVSVVVAIDKGTPTTLKTGAAQLEQKAPTGQFELHITVTAHVGLPELELWLSLAAVTTAWQIGTARIESGPSGAAAINNGWLSSYTGKLATISLKQGDSVTLVLALTLKLAKNDLITIDLSDVELVTFGAKLTYQKIHFSH